MISLDILAEIIPGNFPGISREITTAIPSWSPLVILIKIPQRFFPEIPLANLAGIIQAKFAGIPPEIAQGFLKELI